MLIKGHNFYPRYLEIKQSRDAFRAVDHAFEAWLTRLTGITEITRPVPESLHCYAYKIRSFQSILANVTDRTYLAGDLLMGVVYLYGFCFLLGPWVPWYVGYYGSEFFCALADVVGVVTVISSVVITRPIYF